MKAGYEDHPCRSVGIDFRMEQLSVRLDIKFDEIENLSLQKASKSMTP